ncbi:MAG: dipeptide/oligopeptide/nickel ABC transporter ATP-binding protein [Spirochaetes bacterium GWD1_61_31]|nr:MAG: dipeptide/oligopeptide/nickel ABC transporter ATP-binding protein [Spirochaetes bacterium GWB1_60_80]OHD33057.1 MAG: dipeptide/oligopeptide/nickel ABC transporter ATP-binding protein [Spirochaetes bacterium GWC1_61_12]OHD44357.1 MAG: dipeptide/oligopeptide/nickel ABC transporter ATP-binding protein [Spirochaetes bacterium GWD1_61_31]OHD46890.1 MAG: dipeptide/oligopeptide/nickel ABC transporter ATP-binding protein [Spirochaetes bacterium GWE1_60_18]OHD61131.1 MAG: dipeptide/oligopeptide/
MENILDVKNLRLYYHTQKGAVKALDDVTFTLKKGETLGLVGESGCGKTTTGVALLRMPAPPGRIEEGSQIFIDGQDIMAMSEAYVRKNVRWEQISMVFQGAMNCLTPVYTIGKQMLETLQEHRSMDKKQAEELIREYLGLVGLPPEVAGRYPHELSGGMKQRVVIATALFLKPKLVVLDEPTTALDVIVQAQIVNLLKKLKKTFDLSFIFITHDLALEAEICDRICVMYAGKIVELGTNQQIYGKQGPMHPYTEKLLAATPLLKKKVDTLAFIPGAPPDLINPPSGCRFHPRCHVVMDKCHEVEPPLIEIEPGHMVACWRCTK